MGAGAFNIRPGHLRSEEPKCCLHGTISGTGRSGRLMAPGRKLERG
nr:MAG TPA: hypothetical protein [Caudoviricetes sp.]